MKPHKQERNLQKEDNDYDNDDDDDDDDNDKSKDYSINELDKLFGKTILG